MFKKSIPFAVLILAGSATAQSQVVNERGKRASTRLIYGIDVDKPGEAYLHYGAAKWNKRYASEIDKKEAAHFRLGDGFWATLHTNLDIEMGGRKVPANIWYVGLYRDAEAAWSMTLMDASKVARLGKTSGSTRDVKPDLRVPLSLSKDAVSQPSLRVEFVRDEKNLQSGELQFSWGGHRLSASYRANVKEFKPKDEPEFRKLNPRRTIKTKSGLEYEEVRAGVGRFPMQNQNVVVHYVGWHVDGRRFDSSFLRKQPAKFPVTAVIAGWTEGLQLMKPGAVFRFKIPSKLAYGDRGVGGIKPGETLHFWVELRGVE